MSVYDTLDFQPMFITDVFDSVSASRAWYDKNKIQDGPGMYPYVSRSRLSNGHESTVGRQDRPPNAGNAITVGVDTQSVFYQPTPFYTSVKIQVLRHPLMDEFNGPVLVALLREQMMKFQWGNGVSLVRLRVTQVMIPVTLDINGEQVPDWDGMTRLGEELFARVVADAEVVRRTSPGDDDALPNLEFEPRFITEVFASMKATRAWYDKSKLNSKGPAIYPFVSRTKVSNGVDGFCSRQEKDPEPGNAITIGLDTQTIGYQPTAFYTSQNIQVLRDPSLTVDSALVLAALLRQQMEKFSWGGNGATLGRLVKTQIMVPVTTDADGETVVDWDGMTQYGRALRIRAERVLDPVLGGAA